MLRVLVSAVAVTGALAAPMPSAQKISRARELLNAQHNSSGFPFRPNYPAGKPTQIVGGAIIDPPHKFPFLTSMQRDWPANPGPFCGASLVAPNWILTAAHCTEGFSASDLTVLVNWDDVQVTNPSVGEARQVSGIVDHPDYNRFTLENDVSLLFIEEASTYTPVQLDDGQYSEVGMVGPVAGWGRTNNGSPSNFPDRPHAVDVPVWTNFRCNEPQSYSGQVTDDMICAGETGMCSCNGDSGGPMFKQADDGSYHQSGVVSWGASQCGAANLPGVYARVSFLKDWIGGVIRADYMSNSTATH